MANKEELMAMIESLTQMEEEYLKTVDEFEVALKDNEIYRKIKEANKHLLNIQNQKSFFKRILDIERMKEEKKELNKTDILNSIFHFFQQDPKRSFNIAEIISHLKKNQVIHQDSNPGIAVGSFMRSDKRFKFLHNERMWVLSEEIPDQEKKNPESGSETNNNDMNT